jgi:hypothetical protein
MWGHIPKGSSQAHSSLHHGDLIGVLARIFQNQLASQVQITTRSALACSHMLYPDINGIPSPTWLDDDHLRNHSIFQTICNTWESFGINDHSKLAATSLEKINTVPGMSLSSYGRQLFITLKPPPFLGSFKLHH